MSGLLRGSVCFAQSALDCMHVTSLEKKRKKKFTLFSDHNGTLLRRQPGAMTICPKPKVDLACFVCFCLKEKKRKEKKRKEKKRKEKKRKEKKRKEKKRKEKKRKEKKRKEKKRKEKKRNPFV